MKLSKGLRVALGEPARRAAVRMGIPDLLGDLRVGAAVVAAEQVPDETAEAAAAGEFTRGGLVESARARDSHAPTLSNGGSIGQRVDRPTLTEWRACAGQLAAAYEEIVDIEYLGDAAEKVKANSPSLARFRRLSAREGNR